MDDILRDLNRRLDHAALRPDLTEKDIINACRLAAELDLRGLVVNPIRLKLAADQLKDSRVKPISVAGFPLGANRTELKLAEALRAVTNGAAEIDMVANIGWIVEGQYSEVESEIAWIRQELPTEVGLKVIIEAGLLTADQQRSVTGIVVAAGAQFVKTSTGFFGGATIQQVQMLAATSKVTLEVKASGGIKTIEHCREFLLAGATCLGTSSSEEIMRELAACTE